MSYCIVSSFPSVVRLNQVDSSPTAVSVIKIQHGIAKNSKYQKHKFIRLVIVPPRPTVMPTIGERQQYAFFSNDESIYRVVGL